MSRHLEFEVLVDEVQWDGRRLIAAGRCMSGPVFVGDSFSEVRVGEEAHPASLEVVEIRAYGQLLGELDPVVTAELLLVGAGGDPVSNPSTLVGDVEDL